jgi:hypothetical protein
MPKKVHWGLIIRDACQMGWSPAFMAPRPDVFDKDLAPTLVKQSVCNSIKLPAVLKHVYNYMWLILLSHARNSLWARTKELHADWKESNSDRPYFPTEALDTDELCVHYIDFDAKKCKSLWSVIQRHMPCNLEVKHPERLVHEGLRYVQVMLGYASADLDARLERHEVFEDDVPLLGSYMMARHEVICGSFDGSTDKMFIPLRFMLEAMSRDLGHTHPFLHAYHPSQLKHGKVCDADQFITSMIRDHIRAGLQFTLMSQTPGSTIRYVYDEDWMYPHCISTKKKKKKTSSRSNWKREVAVKEVMSVLVDQTKLMAAPYLLSTTIAKALVNHALEYIYEAGKELGDQHQYGIRSIYQSHVCLSELMQLPFRTCPLYWFEKDKYTVRLTHSAKFDTPWK